MLRCAPAGSFAEGSGRDGGGGRTVRVRRGIEQAGETGQVARCAELMPRAMQLFERFSGALENAGWIADPVETRV